MNEQFPALSIVVPVFNAEKFIDGFIESIRNQTFSEWELMLVDDGSTDGTIEIVKTFCDSDSRIKLLIRDRQPKGADTCRNIGKFCSNGKYLIFFDVDDIVAPNCFQQRFDYMENNPDVDYATFPGESVYIDENGSISYTGRIWGGDTKKDILESFLKADYPFAVWNNIYRSEKVKEIFWDEKLKIFQDFDYIISTLIEKKNHSYAQQAQKDYYYRIGNPMSISCDFVTDEKIDSTIYLFSKTEKRLKENGYSTTYLRALNTFALFFLERIALNGTRDQIRKYADFYCNMCFEKRIRVKFFANCVSIGLFSEKVIKKMYFSAVLYPRRLLRLR